mmetsp:Transcript_15816/g.22114  ORF Transcript_15816/g.22114 Transcript_15816/m.22114 type:complete len:430 (+) Transcript_15816:95-1384(+)|eukprot:jgi/Bigna1/86377/estExt_fgenesh1_pg.C_100126
MASKSPPSNLHSQSLEPLNRSLRMRDLTRKKVKQISNARTKLLVIKKELDLQYGVAKNLQGRMMAMHEHMQKIGRDFVDMKEVPYSDELQSVFNALEKEKLDPELAGQDGRTLFDFVDAQSVRNLQEQTAHEIVIVRNFLDETKKFMNAVDSSVEELARLRGEVTVPETSEQLLNEKVDVQRGFLKDIEYHSSELTDIEAKVGESTASHERLKHVKDSIRRCEEKVASVHHRIQSTAVQYGEAYEKVVTFNSAIEVEVPRLKVMLQEFENNVSIFDRRVTAVSGMITELSNLVAWYRHFHSAYGEMRVEIRRRHTQMQQHQCLMQRFQKELDEAAKEESRRREQFSRKFGRFLPPGLCPALHEPVVSCRVLPLKIASDLPRALNFEATTTNYYYNEAAREYDNSVIIKDVEVHKNDEKTKSDKERKQNI